MIRKTEHHCTIYINELLLSYFIGFTYLSISFCTFRGSLIFTFKVKLQTVVNYPIPRSSQIKTTPTSSSKLN